MIRSFFIIMCSFYMVFSVVEVQAAKGSKSESGEKVKARYSFKKGQKNKKSLEKISQRGGRTYY